MFSGYVLHRRAYRETSAIVDVLSAEQGKVSVVARGVQRQKSALKSLLQPFQPLLFSMTGKSELKNLNQVDAAGKPANLAGQALFSGFYLNELLNLLLPKQLPYPSLFAHYQQALQGLQSGPLQPTLRTFELQLLDELGYGLDFHSEAVNGEPISSTGQYQLIWEQGFVASHGQHPGLLSGAALLAIGNGDWHSQSLQTAKYISRLAFKHLLGDKPLHSRSLFRRTEEQEA